ncbi:hypothetical protein GCM10022236_53090 [Microlunatus ginsengisoli]|uniref:Uncharacterized protein n=1 Tax=Microlunatus ginsengisoli TaxID=363863 RepID=A0ABP7AYX3_9ACTN
MHVPLGDLNTVGECDRDRLPQMIKERRRARQHLINPSHHGIGRRFDLGNARRCRLQDGADEHHIGLAGSALERLPFRRRSRSAPRVSSFA